MRPGSAQRGVADLERAFEAFQDRPDFARRLVRWIGSRRHEAAATWLLRRVLDGRQAVEAPLADEIYARASRVTDWQADLHLLQCMPYLPVSDGVVDRVWTWLSGCVRSERPFVRAWAYNGLETVARQHRRLRSQVDALLADGALDSSAAVRARIRACRLPR